MGSEASKQPVRNEFVNCEDKNVKHLIIFAHGLTRAVTRDNLCHGRALLTGISSLDCKQEVAFVLSTASAGFLPDETYTLTTAGVKKGSERLAKEIYELCHNRFTAVSELTIIGASMGGLFSRGAVNLLFKEGHRLQLPHHIQPHALITLASPHLGIHKLGGMLVGLANWFQRSRALHELQLHDDTLMNLASSGHDILNKFLYRVSYAPLQDDGIVNYLSCSLSQHPPSNDKQTRVVGSPLEMSVDDVKRNPLWCSDSKAANIDTIRQNLLKGSPWIIVPVNLPHSQLATLYETKSPKSDEPNVAASLVSRHLFTNYVLAPTHTTHSPSVSSTK